MQNYPLHRDEKHNVDIVFNVSREPTEKEEAEILDWYRKQPCYPLRDKIVTIGAVDLGAGLDPTTLSFEDRTKI